MTAMDTRADVDDIVGSGGGMAGWSGDGLVGADEDTLPLTDDTLTAAFTAEGFSLSAKQHPGVVQRCKRLCQTMDLTPAELVRQWSAWQINHQHSGIPTLNALGELESQIKATKVERVKQEATTVDTLFDASFLGAFGVEASTAKAMEQHQQTQLKAKKRERTAPSSAQRMRRARAGGAVGGGATVPMSTSPARAAHPVVTIKPGGSFATRKDAGKAKCTYFPDPQYKAWKPAADRSRIPLQMAVDPHCVRAAYPFMFEKLLDRSEILDDRIETMGNRIVKEFGLLKPKPVAESDGAAAADATEAEAPSLAHVALPVQEEAVIVGRVCCDAAGKARLNAQSVMLEGSRDTSNGARVQLDLSAVRDFSVFPGQIVAAKGTNSTGTFFTPSDTLYPGALAKPASSSPDALREFYFSGADNGTKAIDIFVATGPYSTTENLEYDPLSALVSTIRAESPDVVILLGPFVDSEHPQVKEADLNMTYEEVYDHVVQTCKSLVDGKQFSHGMGSVSRVAYLRGGCFPLSCSMVSLQTCNTSILSWYQRSAMCTILTSFLSLRCPKSTTTGCFAFPTRPCFKSMRFFLESRPPMSSSTLDPK
eukprot:m.138387 g.138387  ORF g.138387 m.138387 type:complete len:594 (+) comp17028_c0_seq4:157-1938(+)